MKGLWGGRFKGGMAPEMVGLNRSLRVDHRLWPQDIRGSQAWAHALVRAGLLTKGEGELLQEGLSKVAGSLGDGDFSQAPDEDVHSLVERLLGETVGAVAGKLHTGRSRNDQVATDTRLWGMEAAQAIISSIEDLLTSFLTLAERGLDVVLPGYTHLQPAQPILGAHWAMSHFWPLQRDLDRFKQAREGAGILPLGSGALAGCPFPVDREYLRETLGFHSISENSLDAVSDRDWMVEMAFAGALMGTHLSRFSEDLVLFSTREFGYVRLSEGYCTGSSLMPQKRNPDAGELVRGKSGRLLGNLHGILTLLKGLPTGYNRDLQEDKEFLFDTVDTLFLILPVLSGMVKELYFDQEASAKNLDVGLLATDLADYLVKRGIPFRESHEVVGTLVRISEENNALLSQLPLSVFQDAHPEFREDVYDTFSFINSVNARAVPGGTAKAAVLAQISHARRALGE